jgi:hypothetical protein
LVPTIKDGKRSVITRPSESMGWRDEAMEDRELNLEGQGKFSA